MTPARANSLKLSVAVLLLGISATLVWRFIHATDGISERAFFYDLSEKKLFVAERGLVPPIRGINDDAADGVRAVVVSPNGRPEEKSTWTIAYLETSTPELKRQLDAARAAGTAPEISRTAAQALRLVRREKDTDWVSVVSTEGERIVTEWASGGSGDTAPAVVSP